MPWKELFTEDELTELLSNHHYNTQHKGTAREADFNPVCRIHLPWMNFYWLVTEVEPETGIAFGLCVLFEPELGSVSLPEVIDVKGPQGQTAEVDRTFKADKPLSKYAEKARRRMRG